jgi:signal peptidase I
MKEANVPAAQATGLVDEVVRTFGEVRLRVFGTSMAPSILPGDLISIQRASLTEISTGEVVLFSQKGRLFVHRVVRGADHPGEPCLITRGDRLRYNDSPVSSSELLGRVISIERGNRWIEPTSQPRGWKQVIARLLRTSDYATYLYVRLVALWEQLSSSRLSNKPLTSVIPSEARNLSSTDAKGREIPRHSVPRNDTNPEKVLECLP